MFAHRHHHHNGSRNGSHNSSRHHSQWLVRLLLALLLLAGLAPGVARALAFSRGDITPWAAVCSSVQGKLQAGEGNTADPAGMASHLLEHCPLCALHSDSLAPPPATGAVLSALHLGHGVPQLFLQAAHTLPAWAPAQARAPPPQA